MSQSNLFMIPIDESILLPMESLDQHLVDSSKPSIISPILRNLLLQYGEPAFETLNYSETLPQEPIELTQEQIALPQANILSPLENIVLPLGVPPYNYEMNDVALEDERQEIAFLKRSIPEKRTIGKIQSMESGINKAEQGVKTKPRKRSKMSIDQIVEKIAKSQSEMKEPMPSTSTMHHTKFKQDAEHSSTSKKKGKSKKLSKRKVILEDHDKEPEKKKIKQDSLGNNKELKKKKLKKSPLDKKSEKTKGSEETNEQKTASKGKKKSSKKRKLKDLSLVNESTESLVDIKEETSSTKRKKSVKQHSSNDNLPKSEEESNVSNSSPAKRPRKTYLDINDPIYLEPFKYGWIREVVYRSTNNENTKVKKADIYYHSPEGKKFRTRKEMREALSRHDQLTEDHFIYHPRPIGINDSTIEIVRNSFTTSVLQKKVFLKKARTKSQKPSSQHKDSSQEDNTISLNNSEQNSESVVTENVEDTSISNSQLQEENVLDKTNNLEATIKLIAEPIPSVSEVDITDVDYDINEEESNSTEKQKETVALDNDEYLANKETSNRRIPPNVTMTSKEQSQMNNQNNNESKNLLKDEVNLENVYSLIKTSDINHSTENSVIEPLKTNDFVSHLDKEIRSSSFNNVIDEVDSNKEYELSDTERKLNEYSDDSNGSDYQLQSEAIPEKNLEELNSSFSEKMFISDTSIKNIETAEIKGYDEKDSIRKTETEILTTEKKSQRNCGYITSTDFEVETSKDLISDKVSVPESSATSSDFMKFSEISEEAKSLKESDTDNLITEKTSQGNPGCTESINSVVEMSNNLKKDYDLPVMQNATTSLDITEGSVTGEETKSLKESDTDNLITEKILQGNPGCTDRIDSVVELDNLSLMQNVTTSSDITEENVTGEETKPLNESDTENWITEKTLQGNSGCTESIDSVVEISNNLKTDNVSLTQNATTSSDFTEESVTGEEIKSLKESDTGNLITENILQGNPDCTERIDSVVELDNLSLMQNVTTSSDITEENVTGEETKSLKELDTENWITEKTLRGNSGFTESIDSVVEISNNLKTDNVSLMQNVTTSPDFTEESVTDEETKLLKESDTENLIIENSSRGNLGCIENMDIELEISNDLKSDEVYLPESSSTSLNPMEVREILVDEKPSSLQSTDTCDSTVDGTLNNIENTKSINSAIIESNDSKIDEMLVPESLLILSEAVEVSVTDENTNYLQIIDTKNSAFENKSESNSGQTKDNGFEVLHDLKFDYFSLPKSPSTSIISSKVTTVGEKIYSYKKSDADNLTMNDTLQSNIEETSSDYNTMDITSVISPTTLSTTLSVTSTNSLTLSSDSTISKTQSSNSDLTPVTSSSSATLSQSSSGSETASSSSNVTSAIASESIISIGTSLSSLISTTATVTEGKFTSSSETLSKPSHKGVAISEVHTSESESIVEKLISMPDIKDTFDVKNSHGGIEKVDRGLYNSSESLYSDSAEHTYLVNTEGNTFSFTTASFKKSKQLLPKKKIIASQFKDDINCMKTIAESIKTLSLPSDLTSKQYFLSCPDVLTNDSVQNKNSSEIKYDNINLNINQISPQEENVYNKPHVSCSKDNVSKTDSSDCIQKEKSPSIIISHSKNVWLDLDNPVLNKNKNLISKIYESSDLKKMYTDRNESELSNLSGIVGPSSSSNPLNVISREEIVETTTTKNDYQSTESNSQEFVRSQSYEYQNSPRDEDNENLNNPGGNLDDTMSTTSGNSSQDNSNEHSILYKNSSTMSKYEDFLVSKEFSEMIDELTEENEPIPDAVGVTKSVELHNDLCEFIKLPQKKHLQNKQLLSNEQKKNKSNLVMSHVVPDDTEETLVEKNFNNITIDLADDKNVQKEIHTCELIEESNFRKFTALPQQKFLENRESNSYKDVDKKCYPTLTDVPTTTFNSSIERNYDRITNKVTDSNLQKLASANEAVAAGRYSFECPPEILEELNNLLEMSNENENDINRCVNESSPHSTKLKRDDSRLKDISNSPLISDGTRKISFMKPTNQSTPLSASKREDKKINYQSGPVCPHSMTSFCAGYSALKHIFEYLNFEDLLIAMNVCTVWKELAQQLHLWKTIRIRNSQLTPSLAKVLQHYETEHLLIVEEDSNDWKNFLKVLPEIKSLRVIELCPCPAAVFEKIVKNCPQLKIVNALSLKDESVNVESIQNLSDPEKLQLGGVSSMSMEGDLSFLSEFSNLTHLSLRSIKDLGKKNVNVLQSLQELQSLELGECSEFMNTFGSTILVELKNLKRLRLEKVAGSDCCTDILTSVSKMEKLTQLEVVNIEVSRSFLKCLPKCQNIKKLLIIPMYRKRIAFSNNVIIKCTTKMRNLVRFVWGIPEEFVHRSKSFCKQPYDDCISVLKPIPYEKVLNDIEPDYTENINTPSSIDTLILKMLPLQILRRLYAHVLPDTETDILKIPAYASWNLSIT